MIGGMDAITFGKVYESTPWVAKQMPGWMNLAVGTSAALSHHAFVLGFFIEHP